MSTGPLFLRNDNRVRLKSFRDSAGNFLDAANVTAQLQSLDDPFGTPVVAAITLMKEVGVDGTYSAVWDKTLLSPGGNDIAEGEYILRYIASEGTIELELDEFVEVRYRTEDIND